MRLSDFIESYYSNLTDQVETDSPYLAPVPKRGKTNEPSYTKYVVEFVAELKGMNIEQVAKQTTNNFFNLFSKAQIST